jgi:esterase/lipase
MKRSFIITVLMITGILTVYGVFDGVKETRGALTEAPSYSLNPEESSRWFFADTHTPRAVVLLIHGLNQKPSMWKDMVLFLNHLGAHVYRLTLKGHGGGPFQDMASVTADAWRQNVIDACKDMESHFKDTPKILVGYSNGALVGLDYELAQGHSYFKKQILFAPALALHSYTSLVRPLTYIASYLPSGSPASYRANMKGTAMAAYRAMFDLLDKMDSTQDFAAINTNTLVFINPDDELVDFDGLVTLTETRDLDNWVLAPVVNQKSRVKPGVRHLIIDSASLGHEAWDDVTSLMAEFIDEDHS